MRRKQINTQKIKAIIDLLLNKGANPNIQNAYGFTPLMYASEINSDLVALLLAKGANPNLKSREKKTALDFAQQSKLPATEKEKIIQLLKAKGAKLGKDLP